MLIGVGLYWEWKRRQKSPGYFFTLTTAWSGHRISDNLLPGNNTLSSGLKKGFHFLGRKMLRKLLQIMALAACLTPAWGKETLKLSFFRQPSTVLVAGPGTVVTVHLLQLPFVEPRYAVKYKTDGGELIELWTPRKDILVVEGMYGILTYCTDPERILNFRVVEQKLK